MEEELDLTLYQFKVKSIYGPWVYANLDHDCHDIWHIFWKVPMDCPDASQALDTKTFCRCTGVEDDKHNLIYENDYLSVKGKINGNPVEDKKAWVFYSPFHLTYMVSVPYECNGMESYNHVPLRDLNNTGTWEYKVVGNKFDMEDK